MSIRFYLKLLILTFFLTSYCCAKVLDTIARNNDDRQKVYNGISFSNQKSIVEYSNENNEILRDEQKYDANRRLATAEEQEIIARVLFGARWSGLTVDENGDWSSNTKITSPYRLDNEGKIIVRDPAHRGHFQASHCLDKLAQDVVGQVIAFSETIIDASLLDRFAAYKVLCASNIFGKDTKGKIVRWLNDVHTAHKQGLDLRQHDRRQKKLSEIKKLYSAEIDQSVPISSPILALSKILPFPIKGINPVSIAEQFSASAGVWEGYTIQKHTEMVLERFAKFEKGIPLPEQVSKRDLVLFLSLRDIGKNLSHTLHPNNKKEFELNYSRRIFKHIAREIGMNPRTVKILSRLLHSDTVGDYLKNSKQLEETRVLLLRDAGKSILDPKIFLGLHQLFHQLDAGAYPTLEERLFKNSKSLEYKDGEKTRIDELRASF